VNAKFYFFDASALVKVYIREPGSTWVRSLLEFGGEGEQRAHTILVAEVSVAEVAAAFAVLYRTGRIRRKAWDGAFDHFMDDIHWRYQLLQVTKEDFFTAAALTRLYPLKAYDAVQLAVALRYARILAAFGLPLVFVSGDAALLTAARAEGLPTENPFDHVATEDTQTPS
jgi:hypothetical protein